MRRRFLTRFQLAGLRCRAQRLLDKGNPPLITGRWIVHGECSPGDTLILVDKGPDGPEFEKAPADWDGAVPSAYEHTADTGVGGDSRCMVTSRLVMR